MFHRPKIADSALEKGMPHYMKLDVVNGTFVMRELITIANVEYLIKEINSGRFKEINLASSVYFEICDEIREAGVTDQALIGAESVGYRSKRKK